MIRCDLHIHSIYSDGIHTPDEIAETAVEKSLSCIAVADHDTLDGAAAAETSCKEKGIRLIPASEISSGSDGRTHILSYLPSALSPALRKSATNEKNVRKKQSAGFMNSVIRSTLIRFFPARKTRSAGPTLQENWSGRDIIHPFRMCLTASSATTARLSSRCMNKSRKKSSA